MAKKQSIIGNGDFLKPLVQQIVQDVLESEMEDLLQASKHERNDVPWLLFLFIFFPTAGALSSG